MSMTLLWMTVAAAICIPYLLFALDDLWIDIVAWTHVLVPKKLSTFELFQLQKKKEKKIAILIPAWKESGIIRRMLWGNYQRIQYSNYTFFVGVYPNDDLTIQEVRQASKEIPNVKYFIGSKAGPTSKGQILNHVLDSIQEEEKNGVPYDVFLMHDAEDVIHPLSLKLINHEIEKSDFIQIPVFSLEVTQPKLVAGTYVDEFSESHTKDLLVREYLGAAIPSAGVGTAIKASVVDGLKKFGEFFNEKSLTEDYEVGIKAHASGAKSHFACYYLENSKKEREYIATREYFPKYFDRSVRQKTRWVTGIAIQGWSHLGWKGTFWNRYFLYRDRKSLWTNPLGVLGYLILLLQVVYLLLPKTEKIPLSFQILFASNMFFMLNRMIQRMICVGRIYGFWTSLFVPIRWPVSCTINALSSFHAIKNHWVRQWTKTSVVWVKTEHELPRMFGVIPEGSKVHNS